VCNRVIVKSHLTLSLIQLFFPTAFSDLVAQSDATTIFTENNVTVGAAVQDKLGFLRLYYDYTNSYIYPYLTAIVDVKDGNVRGITWDDSCLFCASSQCNEITFNYDGIEQSQGSSGQPTKGCRITEDECNTFDSAGNTICDLTVYVVWTGTDTKGVAFQSSAFRFSQFPAQEIQDRLSQSLASFNGQQRNLNEEAIDVAMDL
jgi:hypothetical protein